MRIRTLLSVYTLKNITFFYSFKIIEFVVCKLIAWCGVTELRSESRGGRQRLHSGASLPGHPAKPRFERDTSVRHR